MAGIFFVADKFIAANAIVGKEQPRVNKAEYNVLRNGAA